jgi:hypothetical protein
VPELTTSAEQGEVPAKRLERSDGLFREAALTYLAAPDEIDTLMRVITPRQWLALASLGGLVGLALLWSVFGRIAMTVTGRGVLIITHGPGTGDDDSSHRRAPPPPERVFPLIFCNIRNSQSYWRVDG